MLFYIPDTTHYLISYTDMGVCAGFPSPAMDYTTEGINLNQVLIRDKDITRIAYADNNLTFGSRVQKGDILLIDTATPPHTYDLVVCRLDGEYHLRRAKIENRQVLLYSALNDHPPIVLEEEADCSLYGVITWSIRPHRKDMYKGFPVFTDDSEAVINLHYELTKSSPTAFVTHVQGNSMHRAHIQNKDLLVVERLLEPQNNDLVIAYVDREFTLKRLRKDKDCVWLIPANDHFKPIRVTEDNEFEVWGVVTYSIRNQQHHG